VPHPQTVCRTTSHLNYAGIIWAARFSLGPQLDGWRVPTAVRVLGVVALAPPILLAILITIDLRSNG
jgi:hypothetical protein